MAFLFVIRVNAKVCLSARPFVLPLVHPALPYHSGMTLLYPTSSALCHASHASNVLHCHDGPPLLLLRPALPCQPCLALVCAMVAMEMILVYGFLVEFTYIRNCYIDGLSYAGHF